MLEKPVDIARVLAAPGVPLRGAPVVTQEWAVFNDPEFLEPKFAAGEIHSELREVLLDRPLWQSEVPGAAKRFMLYQNEKRAESGQFLSHGYTVLRSRTVTTTAWETVTGQELEDIDDGRRPNG